MSRISASHVQLSRAAVKSRTVLTEKWILRVAAHIGIFRNTMAGCSSSSDRNPQVNREATYKIRESATYAYAVHRSDRRVYQCLDSCRNSAGWRKGGHSHRSPGNVFQKRSNSSPNTVPAC